MSLSHFNTWHQALNGKAETIGSFSFQEAMNLVSNEGDILVIRMDTLEEAAA